MNDLVIWFGWGAVAALACGAAGWYVGRTREMRRVERRVGLALAHVESRHRMELNNFQAAFARQTQELKDARTKSQLQEAADRLALAHAVKRPVARDKPPRLEADVLVWPVVPTLSLSQSVPSAPMRIESDTSFPPTQPMESSGN